MGDVIKIKKNNPIGHIKTGIDRIDESVNVVSALLVYVDVDGEIGVVRAVGKKIPAMIGGLEQAKHTLLEEYVFVED